MTAEEKTEQLKANRDKLEHEIYVTEKKAKACEDEEKFLISTIKQYNRKARTHRLLCWVYSIIPQLNRDLLYSFQVYRLRPDLACNTFFGEKFLMPHLCIDCQ